MTQPITQFEILVFRARVGGWWWRISWTGVDGQRRVYTKRIALSVVIDVLERIGIKPDDERVLASEQASEEELFEGLRAEQSDIKDRIENRMLCQTGPQRGSTHYFTSDGWCIRCGAKRGD